MSDITEPTGNGFFSTAPAPECDHVEGGEIPHTTEGLNVWVWFTYCPECGEKL